jgi:hypothetical protein
MKKFTKFLENTNKKYNVKCNVTLEINAFSEGDAGYNADSILDSISEITNYVVVDIIEENEFDKTLENMNVHVDMNRYKDITSAKDKILKCWDDNFKDKSPSKTDKMEFYHQMRNSKFDGEIIFEVLGDKL